MDLDLNDGSGSVAWHFDATTRLRTTTGAARRDRHVPPRPARRPSSPRWRRRTLMLPFRGGRGGLPSPVAGKHMSFDGRYLHAAPESIYAKESDERRVTLL